MTTQEQTTETPAVASPPPDPTTTSETTTTPAEPEFVPYTVESLEVPEGLTVDEAARDQFLELANEHKFTPDQVKALVGLQADVAKKMSEQQTAQITALHEDWVRGIQSDPEIGGRALESNLAAISTLLNTYGEGPGGQATREAFDMTGAGNHPELVRFLSRIAKKLNEPGSVAPGNPEIPKASLAERLYPSMKGNK